MIIRVKEKVFNVGVTHEENIYIVKLSNLGQQGLSAYQIAVFNGFVGTEQEWLDSLQATGAETFLQLTDTPSTYTGQAGKFPKVNEAEDGLEFGDVPTIQELLEENAAQNNSIAVIQMSNDNLQTVVYSQNDNAVGISSSEVSAYSSFGGASINEQELLITDNNFETRYTLEGINKGDGFDFKEIEIGAGSGKFTIPDLEGEEETAATREWVQANAATREVKVVTGTTYTLVEEDANKILHFTSNTDVTITIPTGLSATNRYEGKQLGDGQLIFGTDIGVDLRVGASEVAKTAEKYSVFGLDVIGTEEYMLYGKLELS